jgi:hypothetical protein
MVSGHLFAGVDQLTFRARVILESVQILRSERYYGMETARKRTHVGFWGHDRRWAPLLHARVVHGGADAGRGYRVTRRLYILLVVGGAGIRFVAGLRRV